MMKLTPHHAIDSLRDLGFQIEFQSHAQAILTVDFPEALIELAEILADISIPIEEIIGSGGGETKGTQRLRRSLAAKGWPKRSFELTKTINGIPRESISHEVDHVRQFPDNQLIALEIEWNNKDPFFDRDLENFKRLHAEGAISVGIIITRGSSLQDGLKALVRKFADDRNILGFEDLASIGLSPTARQQSEITRRFTQTKNPMTFREAWVSHFVADKYGAATTHWRKLEDRIRRGVGNPCPLLLIGIPANVVAMEPASD
ncbi:BglII/BstYI family type II restriction endonuclease [Inquilinus sp. CAU 1745]|uniref:BglII/BstYI family type II restriction endonuclease n=1 Tax=Inquilinus sp. CAU 1745 TaxID=3140369 RepID=UPI00325A80F1